MSLSNRHLGHYLSLLRPDGHNKNESTKPLTKMSMRVHHRMTAVCTKQGVSLEHWQEIVTTMLEKDIGHPKLHHLHIMHLL
jgi:hypothetical protein